MRLLTTPYRARLACALLSLICAALLSAGLAGAMTKVKWFKGFPQRVGSQTVLMWEPVMKAQKYELTRIDIASKQSSTWEVVGTYYADSRAEVGLSYTYQIVALAADGMPIGASAEVKIEGYRSMEPPQWAGSFQEGSMVYLTWDGDNRTSFYNVYKKTKGGKFKIISAAPNANYVDKEIKVGETFIYQIRSVGQSGNESEGSEELAIAIAQWEESDGVGAVERRLVTPEKFILQGGFSLKEPTDLVLRGGMIYVSDMGSNNVVAVDYYGKIIRLMATKPSDYQGVWGIPWGVDIDEQGKRIAVTFHKTSNVRVFDWRGEMIQDIVVKIPPEMLEGEALGFYLPTPQPMDVVLDEPMGLWVSEYSYGQAIYYDQTGSEVIRVGMPKMLDEAEPFRTPTFIERHGETGDIHVVDSISAKVVRVSNAGEIIGSWSSQGTNEGSLSLPKGIAQGQNGELLVVDGMLSTLQAFNKEGKLVATYHSADEEDFPMPLGMVAVAQDPVSGDIYVTSKLENAIFVLRPVPEKK